VVIFDAVGTLIDPDPPAAVVYAQFGRRFGSKHPAESISMRFRDAIGRQDQADRLDGLRRRSTSEPREWQRWQTIVAEVFDDVADAGGELFEGLWGHFSLGEHWRIFDDVVETWQALERRGTVLAVASNFDERLPAILASHEPVNACQRIYWSAEIGYPKPSPEIFAEVARRIDAAPEEILFVGDSPVSDYEGAKAVGWNTKLLCREQRTATGPDEIVTLTQILQGINDE